LSVHGLGLTEHVQGTESVMCLVNLALITGNVGRPGTGVNPLRGQNNVQGAALMGCDPSILTGGVSIATGRDAFGAAWGSPVPSTHGLHLMQMMDAAAEGRLKALWAIGYDVFLTNPNATVTRAALEALELVIVQDLFLNETARAVGSVFLPAAASFERDGTFMNAERRIQRVRRAHPPPGQARPDWEIVTAIAQRMSRQAGFEFADVEAIWDEVRRVWPDVRGITYQRLDDGGLRWPCPTEQHPGTQVLYESEFPLGRATLRTIDFQPTAETSTTEFPYLLTTGRALYHFNAGTMTGRSQTAELRPTDVLEMWPADAAELTVEDGELVTIRSRYGKATLPVAYSPWVKPGELFATFHKPEVFLNKVTGPHRDSLVGAPEFKVTAVTVVKGAT
jgi:formate dehydrogenase major subunit